jgi:peptide/nickel transport system permease protein
MRWFARRLVFYVFALWVALTINFLLPRMMPGSPVDGILQHLTPAQLAANPGIVQTYQALLGGGHNSIWHDYVVYLGRIVHMDFGVSTSHYPAPVSQVIGQTLPYSIFLVGVAFLLSFVLGTAIGMLAAWRRGGVFDNVFVPTFMTLSAFPAFFTSTSSASRRAGSRFSTRTTTGSAPASTGSSCPARSATRSSRCSSSSPPTRAAGC